MKLYPGKNPIVSQLDVREKRILGHNTPIIVRGNSALDALQHIGADGRIMDVAANLAVAQILKDGQRESIAHCVNKSV